MKNFQEKEIIYRMALRMVVPISVNQNLDASFSASNSIIIFSNCTNPMHNLMHTYRFVFRDSHYYLCSADVDVFMSLQMELEAALHNLSIHNLCSSIYHFAGEQSWVMDYLHILTNIIFLAFSNSRCSKIPLPIYRMINMERMNKVKMKLYFFLLHLQWKSKIKLNRFTKRKNVKAEK